MADVILTVRITPRALRWATAGALLLYAAAELGSESFILSTYYPAPSGVYNKLVTTGDTFLAHSGGKVAIGPISPAQALDVAGSVKFSKALMPNGDAGASGQILTSNGPGSAPAWSAGSSVPSGMIAMFDADCPSGWARFSRLDNAFPWGGPASSFGQAGGSQTHVHHHGISSDGGGSTGDAYHTTSNVNGGWYNPPGTDRGGDTYVEWVADGMLKRWGAHNHPLSSHNHGGSTADTTISIMPPYVTVAWCKKQ